MYFQGCLVLHVFLSFLCRGVWSCSIYLTKSSLPGAGRGVFAGQTYESEELIEESKSILIKHVDSAGTMLTNYVFAAPQLDYSMIIFGAASLLNSKIQKNVEHFWLRSSLSDESIAVNSLSTTIQSLGLVRQGDELLTYYGDFWFEYRGLQNSDIALTDWGPANLEEGFVCLSDIRLGETRSGHGKGIFAGRKFIAGELVTISPVLLLPKSHILQTWETSDIINYCFASSESSIVLLPLTNAALVNHGGRLSNLKLKWVPFSSEFTLNESSTIDSLLNSEVAPLDIGYFATRDIDAGEELLLNYGAEWEMAWEVFKSSNCPFSFIDSIMNHHICMSNQLFKQFIGVPCDFFPSSWG